MRQRAFTLIELLVAVSIIGILLAAAAASLSAAQTASRDSRRISDLSTLGKAVDSYELANRSYPTTSTSVACNAVFGSKLNPYLPNANLFPADPKPATPSNTSCATFANGYAYYVSPAAPANPATSAQERYVIVTGLEKIPSPEITSVLPASSLTNVGSATGRTSYYLPGPYCGSSC